MSNSFNEDYNTFLLEKGLHNNIENNNIENDNIENDVNENNIEVVEKDDSAFCAVNNIITGGSTEIKIYIKTIIIYFYLEHFHIY